MHFTIITRCFEPNTLQQIKENVANVFSKQTEHDYTNLILVDLTHGEVEQHFKNFADEKTKVYFVYQKDKEDRHICEGVDRMLENYNEQGYVYMLDDDNLLRENFLDVVKEIDPTTDDVVLFRVQDHPCWAVEEKIKRRKDAFCIVDWSCILTKLNVMKDLKVFVPKTPRQADGRFINKVLRSDYNIKYLTNIYGVYNILRPSRKARKPEMISM